MINKKITFTVFIPCYGKCSYLEKTIESLLDQDYELDIVLCPQGDTDISKITEKYPFIRTLRLEKPSLYKARIFLFNQSNSDYIYYLDDDDILPLGLFKYVSKIIEQTNYLDLYRIPLKTFQNDFWNENFREQNYQYDYSLETKEDFLSKCFDGTYHNGVVHLFIKNCLSPEWFDVDIFQTEDRLITFSIANSVNSKICIIKDAYYLYRKYPSSHSKTLNLLKGRDDFITANNCLKKYMNTRDLIFNSYAIILRVISYLKLLATEKKLKKESFLEIYSNNDIWFYLKLFIENYSLYKKIAGKFVSIITKKIYKKRYNATKLLILIKCAWEKIKYGKVEF